MAYQNNRYRQNRNGARFDFKQLEAQRDFFYQNVYPDDYSRARVMANKVYNDLKPFSEYLRKSIDNLKSAASVGAQCIPVKDCVILRPLFGLLKIKSREAFVIQKPKGNYYALEWNDDWGDPEEFESLLVGMKPVCGKEEIVDIFNGRIILKLPKEQDISQKFHVYANENFNKCELSELSYKDCANFRITAQAADIVSTYSAGNEIICSFRGTVKKGETVTLFDSVNCRIEDIRQSGINKDMKFSFGGATVKVFDEAEGLLVVEGAVDPERKLYCDSREISYDILDGGDICKIIDDENITFNGSKIEVTGAFVSEGRNVEIKGLKFEKISQSQENRYTLKNREGKFVGRYFELIEDDSVKNDVYSNVSYFFSETCEELSNGPQTDPREYTRRRFKIGNRIEREGLIEICEIREDGRLTPVYDGRIPNKLYIVPNERQLKMQLNALRALMDKPFEEHAPLLELMNGKWSGHWAEVPYKEVKIDKWYRITDSRFNGYLKQREFVKKALATPDFAILEGPPGSGKTTVILEIIAQMIMRGQKVMLAASTNAAIDNILERLSDLTDEVRNKILAVRIGNRSAISDSVKDYTVFDIEDDDTAREIIRRANLVCGTIIGVLRHPEFNLGEREKPAVPIYDCLIVDEASKTTFQEFLVPAIYAKKWILSGDLKQLTPYIEQDNIVSSLKQIEVFNEAHQRAQMIIKTLDGKVFKNKMLRDKHLKFCVCVDDGTLNAVCDLIEGFPYRKVAVMGNVKKHEQSLTVKEFTDGSTRAVLVYGAEIMFVSKKDYAEIERYIPNGFIPLFAEKEGIADYSASGFYDGYGSRFEASLNSRIIGIKNYKKELEGVINERKWADEIAWRLCRIQELFLLSQLKGGDKNGDATGKYRSDIEELIPEYVREAVMREISLLKEIALPSIIQLLQQGVTDKAILKNKQLTTTLNGGFDEDVLKSRHVLVDYQHRMHEDISSFSAENIYGGKALKNGTVIDRSWNYDRYQKRAFWLNVDTGENCKNKNFIEVDQIAKELNEFLKFARNNLQRDKNGEVKPWTLACLTYYRAQEGAIKSKVASILKKSYLSSFYEVKESNAEIMIYTVDKFQGKEADVVFLSMVKANEATLGFMDSPNRLNVALTRARYQMVVVGNKKYFTGNRCRSQLLKTLAEKY